MRVHSALFWSRSCRRLPWANADLCPWLIQGSSILQAAPAVHTGPLKQNGSSNPGAVMPEPGRESTTATNGSRAVDSSAAEAASVDGPPTKRWVLHTRATPERSTFISEHGASSVSLASSASQVAEGSSSRSLHRSVSHMRDTSPRHAPIRVTCLFRHRCLIKHLMSA